MRNFGAALNGRIVALVYHRLYSNDHVLLMRVLKPSVNAWMDRMRSASHSSAAVSIARVFRVPRDLGESVSGPVLDGRQPERGFTVGAVRCRRMIHHT